MTFLIGIPKAENWVRNGGVARNKHGESKSDFLKLSHLSRPQMVYATVLYWERAGLRKFSLEKRINQAGNHGR